MFSKAYTPTLMPPPITKRLSTRGLSLRTDHLRATDVIEKCTIDAVPLGASIAVDIVDKKLAVSYKEVALRWQMPFLRRGVLISEGKCACLSLSNPLEMERKEIQNISKHQVFGEVEKINSFDLQSGEQAKEEQISGEVKKKHSLDQSGEDAKEDQISRKVERKHSLDRSREEALLIDESEPWNCDRAMELFLERYGRQISGDVKKKHSSDTDDLQAILSV